MGGDGKEGTLRELTDIEEAILGSVVEMLHTATLVHDDIIDEADTRRGRPSSNTTWGNAKCVLAGDWLYMQSFSVALEERNFRVLDLLISLTQQMVEGELLQIQKLGHLINEEEYFDLIFRKTACLFKVSMQLGTAITPQHGLGDPEELDTQLGEYGRNLGLAFQIVDDVLDLTATEDVLGKPVASDLREGKATLAVIHALERCTRELEGMGFTRLLDFSLVSDSATNPPSFCRLFTHLRHHCFGELSQIFPKGKAPLPLKCCIQSCLQNDWSVSFANRKPLAAGSLLRRKKAIGVFMPDVPTPELLPAFLKMRDQICFDLGISPVNDDTLQAYIDKMQRAIGEMREAVQEKNFVKGVPEVYLRKFSLMKTKPEYVWLGDYPKEAEQRRQGVNSFAVGAR